MFFTSNRWPLLAALVAGGLALSLFWYVTLDDPPGEAVPASGGRYVEAVLRPPERINPLFSTANETDAVLVQLLFGGLVRLGPDGSPEPDLAERWEITNNGQRYVFHLRRGVAWHDGDEFDAEDVIFTFRQIANPDFQGDPTLAQLMQGVVVSARDPLTVEFELEQTYAPFLAYMAIGILPHHLLDGLSATQLYNSTFNQRPVGTGPYRLASQDAGGTVRLAASSVYHLGPPRISEIELRVFASSADVAQALRERQIDGAMFGEGVAPDDIASVRELEGQASDLTGAPFYQIYLNLNAPPFDDVDVRLALQQGYDPATMIGTIAGGRGTPAQAGIPPGTWAFQPVELPPYNAGDASTDLERSGYFRGADGVRANAAGQRLVFTLLTTDDAFRMRIADEIARQWRFIGVDATVEAVPPDVFLEQRLASREFEAALVLIDAGPDPDAYPLWHSSQANPPGLNFSGYRDARLDDALERARQTTDIERRRDLYALAAGYLITAMPAIPIYHPQSTYVQGERVRGFEPATLLTAAARFTGVHEWYVSTRTER